MAKFRSVLEFLKYAGVEVQECFRSKSVGARKIGKRAGEGRNQPGALLAEL